MEEENFQNLMNNIEHALDSNKISILKNLSSETYTCEQVKEILSTFSLASNRVEAFKILAKQIEDPENKGKIMEVFQYDLDSYKSQAYKIFNGIKPAKKEVKKDKELENQPKEPEFTGKITLQKRDSACPSLGMNTFI